MLLKSESVTPFILNFWEGTIALTPSSDVWVDQKRIDAKIIEAQGNYNEVLENAVENLGIDPQTGLAPVVWNSWETFWTGRQVIGGERTVTRSFGGAWRGNLGGGNRIAAYGTRTTQVVRQQIQETIDTGFKTRTGSQQQFVEQWDNTSVGDRVVSKDLITSMRSRNITIDGKRFKPKTRVYAFFDGVDVTSLLLQNFLKSKCFLVLSRQEKMSLELSERQVSVKIKTSLNHILSLDCALQIIEKEIQCSNSSLSD